MKTNNHIQLTLEKLEAIPLTYKAVILNKEKFIEVLSEITTLNDLISIKNRTFILKDIITNHKKDQEGILNIDANGDTKEILSNKSLMEFHGLEVPLSLRWKQGDRPAF